MNKLELELDEKKVLADGEYNLDELYRDRRKAPGFIYGDIRR